MEYLPKKTRIHHFTHPGHHLEEFNSNTGYICDGCKTGGSLKRYRCLHGCDFDLHEYCGTCPEKLSIFMHPHQLSLLMRKPRHDCQNNRTCDVCFDNIEGLFFRCNACDFDVHPLCTLLPQSFTYDLHKPHPLKLESSLEKGICGVCSQICSSWRYRCEPCGFDLHLDCISVDDEQQEYQESERGIPMFVPPPPQHHHWQPPPPFPPAYPPPPYGGYYPYGPFPPSNFYHSNWVPPPHNDQRSGGTSRSKGLGSKMFGLVGQLGLSVISNVIGADISSFISN